jgi:hypothetical protein
MVYSHTYAYHGKPRVKVSRPDLQILCKESSRIRKLQSIPQLKDSVVALAQMVPCRAGGWYQRQQDKFKVWRFQPICEGFTTPGCTGTRGELGQIQFLVGDVLLQLQPAPRELQVQAGNSKYFRCEQVVSLTPRAHRAR